MNEEKVYVFDSKETGEIGITMEVLTRVDLDLAYSSGKIMNLDKLLMQILACENDLEEMSLKHVDSIDLIEKSFVFDFLTGFLDSEVGELDSFMGSLEEMIVNAREEISGFRDLTDLFQVMEAKLHDSEDLLKQSREQIIEIGEYNKGTNLSEDMLMNAEDKPKKHAIEQKRHILRMLERSLGRELELEKKLSEFKQNEEDLKLKQRLTEQVAFAMEEAAEAVWGRFLEAENATEVLLATSKETLSHLQIVKSDLNRALQREEEAKRMIINSNDKLKGREIALEKLESSISELISDNMEVCSLKEKVKLLEEEAKETVSQLRDAKSLNEENEENISEMENIIESLKESIYLADNRADSAEAKVTELNDTNSELNEELNFLKNTNDNNTKKVSSMEKQLRDLEIQLQHARASSEASQEQQNMLYTAIWDMETLVEELKSKVSKAETKSENAEDGNSELSKEVAFLRNKVENLEACLEQVNDAKVESAKDVNIKTKIISEMVVQLALERERIQKQMYGLVEANKVLVEKLQKLERRASENDKNGDFGVEAIAFPKNASAEVTSRSSLQVNGSSEDKEEYETTSDLEAPNGHNQIYIYIPFFVFLVSFLSLYLFNKKTIV